jgi:hypothetical protein
MEQRGAKKNQVKQVGPSSRASRTGDREKIPGLVPMGKKKIFAILLLSLDGKGLNNTADFSRRGVSLA